MQQPWSNIISDEEQRAYNAAGFGRPSGLGRKPALLIIDVQYRTVGTTPMLFWEAIKEFPMSCGDVGWDAVGNIALLLALFRRHSSAPVPAHYGIFRNPNSRNPGKSLLEELLTPKLKVVLLM